MAPTTERRRAAALPAEQRRRVIVEATLPLLLEEGSGISTRRIAEAAGIAEGTIFRVFPDKESVIAAVVAAALDPAPFERSLAAIDPGLPLDARLERAVELLQRRVREIGELLTAAGISRPPVDPAQRPPTSVEALAAVFEPDRHQLRRSPRDCAVALRGLTFAGTHPALLVDAELSPAEIVSLVLDGVRDAEPVPATGGPEGTAPC